MERRRRRRVALTLAKLVVHIHDPAPEPPRLLSKILRLLLSLLHQALHVLRILLFAELLDVRTHAIQERFDPGLDVHRIPLALDHDPEAL
jgi:hypothetical protein